MNAKGMLFVLVVAQPVLFPVFSGAGTVTAEKIYADEVLVREIGMRPPRTPEVLYYGFTNDLGTVVSDDSGNGYDGTPYGCVWTNAGQPAGSMRFDGVDDCLEVGSAPNFPSWDAYTVSIWFLHDGGGDHDPSQYGHNMIDKTAYYHDWHIILWPLDGGLACNMYENGTAFSFGDGTANYMDNTWHHCVVVRNGGDGEFWVDGVLKASSDSVPAVYTDMTLCVGNSRVSNPYWTKSWSGMLDEVRIYDRALTSNEVARLYSEGSLFNTNVVKDAVSVTTNLTVCGALTVTGRVSFAEGVSYSRPLGDLSCGIFTNAP